MLAALIMFGRPGRTSAIVAITYDPPMRAVRAAPTSLRAVGDLAGFAGIAGAMGDLFARQPNQHGE